MASTSVTLPVYIRVGGTEELHLGDFTVDLAGSAGELASGRPQLAALLRAAADEVEHPSTDEDAEVGDAAPE